MEWPDVQALLEHWRVSPPTHELLAAFLGHQAPTDRQIEPDDGPESSEFVHTHSRDEFAAILAAHGLPH